MKSEKKYNSLKQTRIKTQVTRTCVTTNMELRGKFRA